jgi:hypothetical protein
MAEKNSLPLFLEDIYEALRAAVQSLGGAKTVAGRLWPHKPLDQAHKELLDCLNRENPRKLDAEEIIALLRMAREAGFHQAKHWIDAELGYEPSDPRDPEVARDRLADELALLRVSADKLTQQAERLLVQPPSNVKAMRR